MRDSANWRAAVLAYEKGYRINAEGVAVNPKGKTINGYANPNRRLSYVCLSIVSDGLKRNVGFHILQAIQKFGIDAVCNASQVRHLDSDHMNNRPENIGIGTASDNRMDMAPEKRLRLARIASAGMQRKDWGAIEADRSAGMSYQQLGKKHGVGKGALSYHFSKVSKHRAEKNRGGVMELNRIICGVMERD